jgi:hypothetical protein
MERRFDTSITRIRPFFQPLLRRDATGMSWLPDLLLLGNAQPRWARELVAESGPLLEWVSRPRIRPDRALRQFGISHVQLEQCFERRLAPPVEILRWLIEHPEKMTWPKDEAIAGVGRLKREELFGKHGVERAAAARAEALGELERVGADCSGGKWWAFEGFTIADCLLETEKLLVLIEGKRTEPLSESTRWFPQRNQVLRSLEALGAHARSVNKEFAVILMTEEYVQARTLDAIAASLGHLPEEDRFALIGHYLGCVTWSEALARIYFPHTVEDAAKRMKEEMKDGKMDATLNAQHSTLNAQF